MRCFSVSPIPKPAPAPWGATTRVLWLVPRELWVSAPSQTNGESQHTVSQKCKSFTIFCFSILYTGTVHDSQVAAATARSLLSQRSRKLVVDVHLAR